MLASFSKKALESLQTPNNGVIISHHNTLGEEPRLEKFHQRYIVTVPSYDCLPLGIQMT